MIVDRPSLERLAKEDFGAVNLFDDAGDADALEALVDRGRVVPHHPAHLVRHHEVAEVGVVPVFRAPLAPLLYGVEFYLVAHFGAAVAPDLLVRRGHTV